MTTKSTTLEQAFVGDHREMTQHFSRLLQALQNHDDSSAVQLADQLDQLAGPHIQFEEHYLYPEVARHRGEEYTRRLYEEHRAARQALRLLLEHKDTPHLTPEERSRLLELVQVGLDHAISCGTLASHLTALDPAHKAELLARLKQFRQESKRWCELGE